ncbi:MAG TPA: hypothetical protein PKC21_07295 [Oligoflexia bacterium]|nr:hypothetical protein [Oligoflexia bacterium]HMR25143.1 hypothetical protein [Oligoflexia bacterium]
MRRYFHNVCLLILCLSTVLFAQSNGNEDETKLESYRHRTPSQEWQELLSFRRPYLQQLVEFLNDHNDQPEIRKTLNKDQLFETAWHYIATVYEKPTRGGFTASLAQKFPPVTYLGFFREAESPTTFRMQLRGINGSSDYLEIRRATVQDAKWEMFEQQRSWWENANSIGNTEFFDNNLFTYSTIYGMPRLVIPRREQKDYYDIKIGSGKRIRMTTHQKFEFASNQEDECAENPDEITHSIEPELGDCFMVEPEEDNTYILCNSEKNLYMYNRCNPSALARYNEGCQHVEFEYQVYLKASDSKINTQKEFIAASR